MYVTATSPYLLMLVLLVRGCTLPGAWEGIKFYLTPDVDKLADEKVSLQQHLYFILFGLIQFVIFLTKLISAGGFF